MPAQAAGLIDRPRADGITLIYDPAAQMLRADTEDPIAIAVGHGCRDYHRTTLRLDADHDASHPDLDDMCGKAKGIATCRSVICVR